MIVGLTINLTIDKLTDEQRERQTGNRDRKTDINQGRTEGERKKSERGRE